MIEKYSEYTTKDFLRDEDFLLWRLCPTEELDRFWHDVVDAYPEQEDNIAQAIRILHSATINNKMLSKKDEDEILEATLRKYGTRRKRRNFWLYASAAACIIIVCIISGLFDKAPLSPNTPEIWVSELQVDTIQDVQLLLGQKDKITMSENADIQWNKKGEIEVTGQETRSTIVSKVDNDVVFNQLIVPKGKRSFMTLIDGTKIWVNSGTTISFPSDMGKKERLIRVDGEIYIEVVKDEKKPFYVYTSDFTVRVYGTKFNVMAYKDDMSKSVVLVDGKVSVDTDNHILFLNPNQIYKKEGEEYNIYDVEANKYISWKDGVLDFTSERLSDIALRLSRYYGVNIECEESIAGKSCTGKLVLFDNIENTLRILSKIFPVHYVKQDDRIKISMNP